MKPGTRIKFIVNVLEEKGDEWEVTDTHVMDFVSVTGESAQIMIVSPADLEKISKIISGYERLPDDMVTRPSDKTQQVSDDD